jgi:hypothetical protein
MEFRYIRVKERTVRVAPMQITSAELTLHSLPPVVRFTHGDGHRVEVGLVIS